MFFGPDCIEINSLAKWKSTYVIDTTYLDNYFIGSLSVLKRTSINPIDVLIHSEIFRTVSASWKANSFKNTHESKFSRKVRICPLLSV